VGDHPVYLPSSPLISRSRHRPLYRQSAILERETGIDLSRATLDGWVMWVGELLRPITAAMGQELLSGSYIQADETTVGVQMQDGRGKNHQAYLWQYSRPRGSVVFDAACWAHARRKFFDAVKLNPKDQTSIRIVVQTNELFAIDAQARDEDLSQMERHLLRMEKSKPLLDQIKTTIEAARAGATSAFNSRDDAKTLLDSIPKDSVSGLRDLVSCPRNSRYIRKGRSRW
jgi:Transposase IS66 family